MDPTRHWLTLSPLAATPAAVEALERADMEPLELIVRHMRGDWGKSRPRTPPPMRLLSPSGDG